MSSGEDIRAETGGASRPLTAKDLEIPGAVDRSLARPTTWVDDDERLYELEAEVERLRCALDAIANFDPFQGGPIAPRSTPTEQRMRSVAREALSGLSSKKDQP